MRIPRPPATPLYDRYITLSAERNTINDFFEFLGDNHIRLIDDDDDEVGMTEGLILRFFGIDEKAINQEGQAMWQYNESLNANS